MLWHGRDGSILKLEDSEMKHIGWILVLPLLFGMVSCKKDTLTDTVFLMPLTSATSPATTIPPTTSTVIPPEIGKVLSVKLELGQGDAWTGGIRVTDTEFVIGRLEKDFANPEKSYKAGDPCIFFRGVMKNESTTGWWVRFWVNDLSTTLSSFGLIGYTGLFLPAGSSQTFNVPLKYIPDIPVFTVNAYITLTPPP